MLFFANRRMVTASLRELDRCCSEEEVLFCIPPLVKRMIGVAQEESIRFYRRVHSHDAGSYRAVREEFLFLLLALVRWRIERLLKDVQTGRALALLRVELSKACTGLDKSFDHERFWATWDERCEEYGAVLSPERQADPGLSAEAIAPCFGKHLTDRLGEHGAKVLHFSGRSLRDILDAV